ncbi:CsbD family protein [Advenella mimigardefordensis]|uniref:Putative stress response protein, CsbD family n=1 Tax=Advenella mimigardefordensis (strain DSM 17166 / LMG 22922 / DPN7) TaxID=1247726 RepID=W0PBT2_ADVMD|nr:CsbD family protein [Advenella mimigardefordensis]AHG64324.1 putative stress response protein, CsbD family [Advenella mimigardefordensis DPN7]
MTSVNTIKSKAEELAGKGQSALGDVFDDPEMEAEGKIRQASGHAAYTVNSFLDCLVDGTRSNPLGALLAAAAVGLVLGRHLYKK